MIKYFHELTEEEFDNLAETGMNWENCAKSYPQPNWCSYPNAVCGEMGCWALMTFSIKEEHDCKNCNDFYNNYSFVKSEFTEEEKKIF
jgi:hypothetical protein